MTRIGLGNSSDSVTIVIISVTIMTVIAKNYYRDSGHVVTSIFIWQCLTSTYPQTNMQRWWGIFDDIDLDKELEVFLLEGVKSEELVSLPQAENAQNLYLNCSFTIVIVFTVVKYTYMCTLQSLSNIIQVQNLTSISHSYSATIWALRNLYNQ